MNNMLPLFYRLPKTLIKFEKYIIRLFKLNSLIFFMKNSYCSGIVFNKITILQKLTK